MERGTSGAGQASRFRAQCGERAEVRNGERAHYSKLEQPLRINGTWVREREEGGGRCMLMFQRVKEREKAQSHSRIKVSVIFPMQEDGASARKNPYDRG